jgi:hypothetical protein
MKMKTMKAAKLMTIALGVMMLIVTFGVSAVDTAPRAKTTVVTDENYSLAESDNVMEGYVKEIAAATNTNGVGVFMHYRKGADPKERTVMRINFDTIYSWAIVDLTEPLTLTMPETNGRYQTAWVVSEDGFYPGAFTTSGEHKITKEWIDGSRYAAVIIRTQVNVKDPTDLKKANALQDKLKLTQKDKGSWDPANQWDKKELTTMRTKYQKIATGMFKTGGPMVTAKLFGKKGAISLKGQNAGNAFGWGAFTPDQAVYPQYFPTSTKHQTLSLKNIPVKAFWSITVYDKKGFPETDTYNINSAFVKTDADGSVTINFGGDKNAKNYMEIFDGWNFTLRMYEPTKAYLNGTWVRPELKLVK